MCCSCICCARLYTGRFCGGMSGGCQSDDQLIFGLREQSATASIIIAERAKGGLAGVWFVLTCIRPTPSLLGAVRPTPSQQMRGVFWLKVAFVFLACSWSMSTLVSSHGALRPTGVEDRCGPCKKHNTCPAFQFSSKTRGRHARSILGVRVENSSRHSTCVLDEESEYGSHNGCF